MSYFHLIKNMLRVNFGYLNNKKYLIYFDKSLTSTTLPNVPSPRVFLILSNIRKINIKRLIEFK
jgi:hypothetical protein